MRTVGPPGPSYRSRMRPVLAIGIPGLNFSSVCGEQCNAFGPAISAPFDYFARLRAGSRDVRFWHAAVRFRTGSGHASRATLPPAAPAVQTAAQSPAVVSGTPLTMDEAVRMAMENNLGIRGERLNPEIQSYGVVRAQSAFTPSLFSSVPGATAPRRPVTSSRPAAQRDHQRIVDSRSRACSRSCRWAAAATRFPSTDRGRRPTRQARCSARSWVALERVVNQPLLRNFKIDASAVSSCYQAP